jgi:cell division protein ZapD|tara:strand:+ start:416 stop:1162 length:747 start_codon:yes stop_codon:yes gene_type:complete
MDSILYEHPLNERIRQYLKIEQLFDQINHCVDKDIHDFQHVFFHAFFGILDALERSDIRGVLLKDLEKLQQTLVLWSKSPDVNNEMLEFNLRETVKLLAHLKMVKPIWQDLKDDKLLSAIKQRFAIQGGNSSFDLPQLRFWLYQGEEQTTHDIKLWLSKLIDVEASIALILKFIRLRASFTTIETENGFYQDNTENILLLRLKIAKDVKYYPTISGNKYRYSIRFMHPCKQKGTRHASQAITFELASC